MEEISLLESNSSTFEDTYRRTRLTVLSSMALRIVEDSAHR